MFCRLRARSHLCWTNGQESPAALARIMETTAGSNGMFDLKEIWHYCEKQKQIHQSSTKENDTDLRRTNMEERAYNRLDTRAVPSYFIQDLLRHIWCHTHRKRICSLPVPGRPLRTPACLRVCAIPVRSKSCFPCQHCYDAVIFFSKQPCSNRNLVVPCA